jgi:NADH:ubiquinone oxidoreductase subunit
MCDLLFFFLCRMSLFEISLLTVRLGMHTVGNQALNTRNDAQVTRRVSRVVFHNDYNDATNVNNESHHSLFCVTLKMFLNRSVSSLLFQLGQRYRHSNDG